MVDGKFIRDLPDQEFAKGNFHNIPLITNRDAYEGYIFSNLNQTSQVAETTDVSYPTTKIAIAILCVFAIEIN